MSRFARIDVDRRLVAALQRREREAVEAVYALLAGPVFTLARRVLGDVQLAKEVTQDTFVDVIEKAATVETPDAFVAWVRSVAVNHCLMRLRSPWHRRRNGEIPAEVRDGASDAARLDGLGDVERALAQLSPDTRFVVWMHEVEGYTHAEIAGLTGRTVSYSKTQLARAYAHLLAWSTEKRDVEESRGIPERPGLARLP